MPAPKNNRYAAKPEAAKIWKKGRLTLDLGEDLHRRVAAAADAAGEPMARWIRRLLEANS